MIYEYVLLKYILKKANNITYTTKKGIGIIVFVRNSYPLLKKNGCLIKIVPVIINKYNIIALYTESFIY